MEVDEELKLIRQDNLDRLVCERGESNTQFCRATDLKTSSMGRARAGHAYLSDKACLKIITALALTEGYFDVDNRTGDRPEKKRKSGTIATKMVTIRFEGDSFNVSVEVNEKKARQMIMSLLHE